MANTPLDAVVVAGSSSASLGMAEEVSYGKTPPSVALERVRMVSTTLSPTVEMYSSNEKTTDRQGSAPRHGVRRAAGDINIEPSPGAHAKEYAALIGGYWQTPIAVPITTINLTATLTAAGLVEVTATSFDFAAAGMLLGAPVSFTGAHADVNGKKFTVTGHAANKVVLLPPVGFTLAGSPQALTTGTFHIKGARVGMDQVFRSFTEERPFEDIGKFWLFNGIVYNTFSAELPPTGVVTGTFGVMGQAAEAIATASIDGVAEVSLDATDCGTLTFSAAAGTITRSTGSWITDGVAIGNKVQFTGDGITQAQNRQIRTATAVSATVLTVEEAIADGSYTTDYYILKVGSPAYTAAPDNDVSVAVSGAVLVNGAPISVVTGLSLSVDNQMSGEPVVGSDSIPFIKWGNKSMVTVSPTVYFTRGGAGEVMMNAALAGTDISLVVNLDDTAGDDCLSFVFPRVIFAPGQLSEDASTISVQMQGEAAKPRKANPELGSSKVYIYDTTITGIAPKADPLVLTFVADTGTGGIGSFTVAGGVAPYSFDADDAGGTTDATVTKAGSFTFDYAADGTYDPIITDAAGTTATATAVITSAP